MHYVTKVNVWIVVNIVMNIHSEFVIASQMSWCQFNVTEQSHNVYPCNYGFWGGFIPVRI